MRGQRFSMSAERGAARSGKGERFSMMQRGAAQDLGFRFDSNRKRLCCVVCCGFFTFYFEISFQSRENDSVTHRVIHRPGFCAYILYLSPVHWASWVVLVVKNPPANVGDLGSVARLGRSPGGGHGNPLQYSCLETSP